VDWQRRGGVRLQRIDAFPLLDDDERVRTELGLKAAHTLGVDGRAVLDASLLGMHRRHVGAEFLQDGVALAWLGGDDGEYMNHRACSCLCNSGEDRFNPTPAGQCRETAP
jgi:hypothetical protein